MRFTEDQLNTIINGLYVAIERFQENASYLRENGQGSLADQFERQILQSQEVIEKAQSQ